MTITPIKAPRPQPRQAGSGHRGRSGARVRRMRLRRRLDRHRGRQRRPVEAEPDVLLPHQAGAVPARARRRAGRMAGAHGQAGRSARRSRATCCARTSRPSCASRASSRWLARVRDGGDQRRAAVRRADPRTAWCRWCARTSRCSSAGSREGSIAPVNATHLLFAIWAMTQSYADFSAQMALVLRNDTRTADFADAEKMITDMMLKTVVTVLAGTHAELRGQRTLPKWWLGIGSRFHGNGVPGPAGVRSDPTDPARATD